MKTSFDHEKLNVYQESINFVTWVDSILENIPKSIAAHNHLDRASTSIPLNIAEGNGKFTAPDRCKFFDTARGSALECAACLDVLVTKKMLTPEEAANPNIARVSRNVRPSGFDANDLRRSCSGLALSKVRKHCVETSAREVSLAEGLMERARQCSCNKQAKGKDILLHIVSMLVGLIKTTSSNRLYEEPAEYDKGEED